MGRTIPKTVRLPVIWISFLSIACFVIVEQKGFASPQGGIATPPTVTKLLPDTGPVGRLVMIVGANFGSNRGASTVQFAGKTATPTNWSDTEIVVPVPNSAATGNVIVTVNGVPSNPTAFTVGPVALEIASPASGAIVNQGQTMSVSVKSPANVTFANVAVVGEGPVGTRMIQSSVPAQLSFTIPSDVASKSYMLTAFGTTASGQNAESDAILIDIERPDLPVSIAATMNTLSFEIPGHQFPLTLLGTFADGSVLDITRSSHVTYATANASSATVDAQGIVTSKGPGQTYITATYTLKGRSVRAKIPTELSPRR